MNKQVDAPDTQNDTNLLTSDVLDSMNKMIEKGIEYILLDVTDVVVIIIFAPVYLLFKRAEKIWDLISKTPEEREAKRKAELESNKAKRLNQYQRYEVNCKILECLKSEQGKLRSKVYETLKEASELQNKIQAESKKIVADFIDKNIEQARFLNI